MTSVVRLAKNTAYNISAYAVSALVSFITLPLMLRAYGTSVYGVFILASSVVGVMALFDLGLTTVLTKEIAQVGDHDAHRQEGVFVRFGLAWLLLIGVATCLALLLISRASWLFSALTPVEFKLLQDMLVIHAIAQLVLWPAKIGTILLSGRQRFDAIALANLFVALAIGLIIGGVLLWGRGPLWITGLSALVTATVSIGLMVYARIPVSAHLRDRLNRSRPALRGRLLRLAMPVFVAQIATFLMLQQTDRFVIGVFISATAIALYEVGAKFSFLMFQATSLLVSALPPFVARLDTRATREEMASFFLWSARWISLLMVPLHFLLIALAPSIVALWVGPGFEQSVVIMRILLLASALLPFHFTADSILIARDAYHRWAPYAVGTAVLNLMLSIVLASRIGLVGVALGTLISYLVDTVLYIRITAGEIGYSVLRWASSVVGASIVPSIGVALFALALSSRYPPRTLSILALYVVAGVLIGFLIISTLILSASERRELRDGALKLVHR